MELFWFALTVVAVWRCVVFVRQDGLIEGTRTKVTVALAQREGKVAAKVLYLIGCQWCLSVWFALGATVWWAFPVHFSPVEFVVTWLATAGLASIIDLITDNF